ncbi:cation:proton antiporter [Verrucomicrobiaceae bacterium N1E253]|uniref:Cation:proton antiporter n=1 Tax=Oceaniferula marina TaxID=2748318 RepID=A0A851GJX8_9BACT|nr:sodium:proton antiporter [Oceaniferula marina]NWK55397.1 cation:proton antiporter [Oceaniferula marina]
MTPLTYFTLVLALGIAAQWLAWRFKLPSILLLLAFGFGLGHFTGQTIDSYLASSDVLLSAVGLCVAVILFEGGLTLKFSDLKESGTPVLRLCTLGVVFSFILTYGAVYYLLGYDWQVAALLGAILVVTGPTVIAPLLRHIKPSRKVGNVVKWEGIVVDPIGAILAVLVYQAALAGDVDAAMDQILHALGMTLLVGVILAFLLAKIIELLLKHHLIPDYLHSVFLLAVTATAFAASNAIQSESGLLTCTVLGIALANQKSVSVKHILEFKENLRVLIISILFIVLSGRVHLDALGQALVPGLILLAALIIVVRPFSVFVANAFSKRLTLKEQFFLSAMAPRGIVAAAVTAIFALEFEHAIAAGKLNPAIGEVTQLMVPIVFIVIVGTVAIYGLLGAPLARRLKLASKNPRGILFAGAGRWVQLTAKALHDDGHDVLLLDTNYDNIARAKLEGIPAMRANILSEYVEDELELNGLGQLISTTPNDEVNSLASQDFIHIFDSRNVWQVAPSDDGAHHRNATAKHKRGRICFPGRPKFKELETLAYQGGVVKETTLTDKFSFDDFNQLYGDGHILLFYVTEEKGLRIANDEMKEPGPGTTLYAMVRPEDA